MGDCPMTDAPSTATDLPSNATIAALFDELGDLYELDGAVVHRVVAYRNAAKSVREAPRSVASMALDGLQAAAEEHRLRDVRGFGEKFEETVLASLAAGAGDAPRERVLLSKALDIADSIIDALRAHPASDRVELAGSA